MTDEERALRQQYAEKVLGGLISIEDLQRAENLTRERVHRDAVLHRFGAKPIEELNFSTETYNILKRDGVHTLANLASTSEVRIVYILNVGSKAYREITDKLAEYELTLAKPHVTLRE